MGEDTLPMNCIDGRFGSPCETSPGMTAPWIAIFFDKPRVVDNVWVFPGTHISKTGTLHVFLSEEISFNEDGLFNGTSTGLGSTQFGWPDRKWKKLEITNLDKTAGSIIILQGMDIVGRFAFKEIVAA